MTEYTARATIAVPAAYMYEGNQIALVLGESAADDQTFTYCNYQDADGNLYSVCSTVAKPIFAEMAGQPLQAPEHAPDADIEAATRAQAMLAINSGPAAPDKIAVILGDSLDSAQDHIAVLGLARVETDEDI